MRDGRFDLTPLEPRTLLSGALDLVGVTALRRDATLSSIDGEGFTVAVIDTGIDATHPLLSGNVRAVVDITGSAGSAGYTDPHGTHVAGIVASQPDPSRGYGGGVAPGAGLVAINVFTTTSGGEVGADNSAIEQALRWVIDHRAEHNIVAVNMSLGAGFYTSTDGVSGAIYADEIHALESAGVTVVSAAGNSYGIVVDGSTGQAYDVQYPNSAAPGIISTLNVGAVWEQDESGPFVWGSTIDYGTDADRVVSFSQRPPTSVGNAIFAPGATITSTWPGGGLQSTQGTSMASPMVAGAVALLQDAAQTFAGRTLATDEVRSILQETGASIVDGDDESDGVFLDLNGNGQLDAGETDDLVNTGLAYRRLDLLAAVQWVRDQLGAGTVGGGDPNSRLGTATDLGTLDGAPFEPVRARIGSDGGVSVGTRDVDLYRFNLAVPGRVAIEVASDPAGPADFNSYLRLFDAGGRQLAANDDNGVNGFSVLKRDLDAGTYFVGVSGFGNTAYRPGNGTGAKPGKTGNYRLGLSLSAADGNGLLSGARSIRIASGNDVPVVFEEDIGSDFGKPVGSADVDFFRIVAPDDGTMLVDLDTPYPDDFVDTYLRVFDEAGTQIGFSDDNLATSITGTSVEFNGGGGTVVNALSQFVGHTTDSFVIGTVSRGDVYYVGVSDFDNRIYNATDLSGRDSSGAGGRYQLEVRFANRDINGSIEQAVSFTSLPVVSQQGQIGSDFGTNVGDRDVDMFALQAPSGGILEIDVDSFAIVGNSDTVDAVIRLFDADGSPLASSDDIDGPDPLLQVAVSAGQTLYAAVSGKGNTGYDPFLLGSGTSGDDGFYTVSISVRPSSLATSLRDDQVADGAIASISPGATLRGEIGMDGGFVRGQADSDLYRFVPTSSGPVEIRTLSIDGYSADTLLKLLDASGIPIAQNDDADGTTKSSRLQVDVVGGQTYFVQVLGASGTSGSYGLTLDGGFASIVNGVVVANGTSGNDRLVVNARNDRIRVYRGAAMLSFAQGPVVGVQVFAGAGNDRVEVGAGLPGVYVDGGDGNDLLVGGPGKDTLTAGAGRNTLLGGDGDDRLNGSGGRDSIAGQAGNDRLYGNGGDDTLDGGGNVDRLFAGLGNDLLFGGGSNDKLYADAGNDTLFGQAGADLLDGSTGTDSADNDPLDTRIAIEVLS